MVKSKITEIPQFFQNYINLVPEGNLLELYKNQTSELIDFYSAINENKSLYKYEKDKWSIRQIIGHITDTERIFGYRALRISRNDATPLSGFDENKYVTSSNFDNQLFSLLLKHFINIRNSNLDLFSSFDESDFDKSGIVEGNNFSVRLILAVLIGHSEHHKSIVRERYL